VFGIYPWLGLIRSGVVDAPLHVLDRCRIRWARVEAVVGDRAVVRGRLLEWDGSALRLGAPRTEEAVVSVEGLSLAPQVRVGQWCALHWEWICTPLALNEVARLRAWTERTLAAVNDVAYPAPAAVLA
jgi:hypothetical protein